MRPSEKTTELARQILARRENHQRPFILFLGQACADAAGVPTKFEIARQVFSDPDLFQLYLQEEDLENRAVVLDAFDELLEEMTTGQRYRMLQSFYASIPVPSFYQDLALLVKAGFFELIVTTNIDNLLEQAFGGAGLIAGRDYQVQVLGRQEELPWRSKAAQESEPPVRVIKLHGDLALKQAAITREEIDEALEPQRLFIKGQISGDMIMVGYQLESEPLNQWLSWVPGDLWWVSPEPPDEQLLNIIEARRSVYHIHGEETRPEVFFGQLAWLLLRTPIGAWSGETDALPAQPGVESLRDTSPNLENVVYTDESFLANQLRRTQSVLQALEQVKAPGGENLQIETQIEYQRRQMALLEAQLRDLEPNRERLLKLMNQVRTAIQQAAKNSLVDPNAAAYARKQWSAVQSEYRRETPNQSIVAAAIGATVVLAEQLGEQIVDRGVVQELASYAPSAVGRRL
jgi:hypothetical protein